MPCAVRLQNATKRYASMVALDGVDLRVEAGEWVGLLGPNGAGKTTLMLAIAGLVRLDQGSIELHGRRRQARENVGLVPQEIALYANLTVQENLSVFGRLHGVGRREIGERVAWALDWTGLKPRRDHVADKLSGGMRRRLNIACAVLHRPSVVLLDEPTVGVDRAAREEIRRMLADLRQMGACLIQSTHELQEVERCCDRLLIMNRGRVVAAGTVGELVERTLAEACQFRLRLDRPFGDPDLGESMQVDGDLIHGHLHDPASELPRILERVRNAGRLVREVHVDAPGLDAVLATLTETESRP